MKYKFHRVSRPGRRKFSRFCLQVVAFRACVRRHSPRFHAAPTGFRQKAISCGFPLFVCPRCIAPRSSPSFPLFFSQRFPPFPLFSLLREGSIELTFHKFISYLKQKSRILFFSLSLGWLMEAKDLWPVFLEIRRRPDVSHRNSFIPVPPRSSIESIVSFEGKSVEQRKVQVRGR